ncbi:unnamed protein product [Ilex paraguariensis]|uniref:Uncharacterized protein n=1 Tax=Ilex paraguariensis TaxID=185542 RepID=A0ABC8SIW1_9AQUA
MEIKLVHFPEPAENTPSSNSSASTLQIQQDIDSSESAHTTALQHQRLCRNSSKTSPAISNTSSVTQQLQDTKPNSNSSTATGYQLQFTAYNTPTNTYSTFIIKYHRSLSAQNTRTSLILQPLPDSTGSWPLIENSINCIIHGSK